MAHRTDELPLLRPGIRQPLEQCVVVPPKLHHLHRPLLQSQLSRIEGVGGDGIGGCAECRQGLHDPPHQPAHGEQGDHQATAPDQDHQAQVIAQRTLVLAHLLADPELGAGGEACHQLAEIGPVLQFHPLQLPHHPFGVGGHRQPDRVLLNRQVIALRQQKAAVGLLHPELAAQVGVEQQLLAQQLRLITGVLQAGLNRLRTPVEISPGGVDQVALPDPETGNRCTGEAHKHGEVGGQLQLTLQAAQKLLAPGAG